MYLHTKCHICKQFNRGKEINYICNLMLVAYLSTRGENKVLQRTRSRPNSNMYIQNRVRREIRPSHHCRSFFVYNSYPWEIQLAACFKARREECTRICKIKKAYLWQNRFLDRILISWTCDLYVPVFTHNDGVRRPA